MTLIIDLLITFLVRFIFPTPVLSHVFSALSTTTATSQGQFLGILATISIFLRIIYLIFEVFVKFFYDSLNSWRYFEIRERI